MGSGNIQLSFSADSAAIVRELARQEAKVNELTAKVKELKTAHNEAGAAGEQAGNRVERATGPAAKAAWEENRAIKETKKSWEEQAAAAEKAVGGGAVLQMKNYAASVLSVGAALGVMKAALTAINEERERGADSLKSQMQPRAALAQLAGGDPAKLQQLIAEANRTREEVGLGPDQAQQMQFALGSLGLDKDRAFFAGFADVMQNPAAFAEAAGTWQKAFGDQEAGSVRAVSNKMLAAGGLSKTASDVFATAMSSPAALAGQIGASDEEVAAAGAILTRSSKSADVTATQLRALVKSMIDRGMTGGLLGGVLQYRDELAAIASTPGLSAQQAAEEKVKLFGSVESMSAYQGISQQWTDIVAARDMINREGLAVGDDDLSGRTQGLIHTDPSLASVRALNIEQQKLLIQQELKGQKKVEVDTQVMRNERLDMERDVPDQVRLINRFVDQTIGKLGPIIGQAEAPGDATTIRGTRPLNPASELLARGMSHLYGWAGAADVGDGGSGPNPINTMIELQRETNQLLKSANAERGKQRPTTLAKPDEDR